MVNTNQPQSDNARVPLKLPASLSRRREKFLSHRRGQASLKGQYQFLVGRYIDQATLERAQELGQRWHVPPHQVMIAMGWLTQKTYTRALAEYAGLNYFDDIDPQYLNLPQCVNHLNGCYRTGFFRGERAKFNGVILTAHELYPSAIKQLQQKFSVMKEHIGLISTHQMRKAIVTKMANTLTRHAILGMEIYAPGCSARQGVTLLQSLSLALLFGLMIGVSLLMPNLSWAINTIALSICFLPIVIVRLIACLHIYLTLPKQEPTKDICFDTTLKPERLPVYTILVPIFREHRVLPDLVQALLRLDYPRAKLDVKLIFESEDIETLNCAKKLTVPDSFEFIVVPKSHPQTKPKALNYAMQFARGDYAVIFDAEDQPERDQLLKAVRKFRRSPANVVCLQARLNFYNASENWLTKQFAIEYTSLFSGLLPTLQYLNFPIPLGGTSNHFRMSALQKLGCWDAFNVTEDADLGVRMYRAGYKCRMLNSTTYEEATCSVIAWIKQRTRWLKGWMQTYAVHMRSPIKLLRELGLVGFLGFQMIIGGLILSALIHPIFLLVFISVAAQSVLSEQNTLQWIFTTDQVFNMISAFNLLCGYASVMLLAVIVLSRKRITGLKLHILSMPVYWLLISIAAYRAFYQWLCNPFHWEKTSHGVSKLKPAYQVK
ncbi:MAG: glycosyltransferase family 2 protein [Pseudomonadota bacterium]